MSTEVLFVGRSAELRAVSRCAERAAAGEPVLLLVEAGAGMGKTALLRRAVGALDGFSVWRASCDSTEQDWPFAMVGQWLRRADPRLTSSSAILNQEKLGPEFPPVAVGAELLRALAGAQEFGPVALVVDDVQWADDASLKTLDFVLRRLYSDRVLVVTAARTESHAAAAVDGLEGVVSPERAAEWQRLRHGAARVRELRLRGLSEGEVSELVKASAVSNVAAPAIARRLWELTGGQPLYVHSVLAATALDDLLQHGSTPPISGSLEGAVRRTLARLPAGSRALAEALAVLDARVPLALAGAVSEVDEPAKALEPLLAAGLAVWWPDESSSEVRLAHPLQRGVVYLAMRPDRRRELHTRAAPRVAADTAWGHRVAASRQNDPALVDALTREATRKAAEGYLDRAATLMSWAAELADTRERREESLLTAAKHTYHTLNPRGVLAGRALRPAVEACAPCALRTLLLSCYAYGDADYTQAVRLAEQALVEVEAEAADDHQLIAYARFRLALASITADDPARARTLMRRSVRDPTLSSVEAIGARWLLGAAVLFTEGPQQALRLPWVADLPDNPADTSMVDTTFLLNRGYARLAGGELHLAHHDFATVLEPARAGGTPANTRVHALFNLAPCLYLLGDWALASSFAEQTLIEGEIDGFNVHYAQAHTWNVFITAAQARWQAAEEHLAALRQRRVMPVYALLPVLAEAALAQARADHDAMLRALRLPDISQRTDRPYQDLLYWLYWSMRTEALIATRHLGEACSALAHLQAIADQNPCLRPITAWCTGKLAEARDDPGAALAAYHLRLDAPPDPEDPPLHVARLEQDAGRLHQACGHDALARELLDQARYRYVRLGARAFSQK